MCFASVTSMFTGASGGSGSLLGGVAQLLPSVAGAIGGAASANSSSDYQATIASNNAYLAELRAQAVEQQGAEQTSDLRRRAQQMQGAQRTAFAANGVALNEGSPVAVTGSTQALADQDISRATNNAARTAFGYRQMGANYNAQATALSSSSPAATSLLGSAGGVANKWYSLYSNGAFGSSNPTSYGIGSTFTGSAPSLSYSASSLFGPSSVGGFNWSL